MDKNNPYGNNLEKEVITTTEQKAAQKHGDISKIEVTRENHDGQIIEITTALPENKILEDYKNKIKTQLQ